MKYVYKIIPLGILFILSACVSLLPESSTPPQRLWLNPTLEFAASLSSKPPQILAITRPTAPHMLDSERLQIRNLKGTLPLIDHLADVEWHDHLPLIVQRHLAQNLSQSQKFKAVGLAEESFKPDLILETDMQHFDIVLLKDEMYAEVALSVKLLQAQGREIVWAKNITSKMPLTEHNLVAFVKSLTKAYETVLQQLINEI